MTRLVPKILLIESDPDAADKIVATLAVAGSDSFSIECVRELSDGLDLALLADGAMLHV